MAQGQTYDVNLIFKGLFVARPTKHGLAVMLPDGRNPQFLIPGPCDSPSTESPELHKKVGPYQEHHGILEFFTDDWWNQGQALPPNLGLIEKPRKARVAFSFLGEGIAGHPATDFLRFSGSRSGALQLSELGPPEAYSQALSTKTLKILETDPQRSFSHLTPFSASISTDAWERCVGVCLLSIGEVFSTRRSRKRSGEEAQWYFIPASQFDCTAPPPTNPELRAINLDLQVRFAVSADEMLVVEVLKMGHGLPSSQEVPFLPSPGDASHSDRFVLSPKNRERGITLWIKNRELRSAVVESDSDDDSVPICDRDLAIDRDHGLVMRLAKNPEDVVIPRLRVGGVASCGAACGGCGGGGG